MPRPLSNEYTPFQANYIALVSGNNFDEIINNHSQQLLNFYCNLPNDKGNYAYAENKWTIKEVMQHVIDTERILAYRALCLARGEKQALPGFDENEYAAAAFAHNRSMASLKDEFEWVRGSTNSLLLSFNEKQLTHLGTANSYLTNANAIGFIIYGHLLHHKNILEERYLQAIV
jgi:uncharacterized damage-inducible protein DinB